MSAEYNDAVGKRIGIRLDALDAALAAFEPRKLDTLITLRRQIEFTRQDVQGVGMGQLAAAADRAYAAGVLDARRLTEELMAALRDHALKHRAATQPGHDLIDPATGLMKREAFARLFSELTHRHPHVAVAAVAITNAPSIRKSFGRELATRLNTHVGAALARIVRGQDCVASFEEDHFTLFLPGEDARGLASAITRIETALSKQPFNMPDGTSTTIQIAISGKMLDRTATEGSEIKEELPLVGFFSRSAATTKVMEARLRAEGFRTIIASVTDPTRSGSALFQNHILDAVLLDARPEEFEQLVENLRGSMSSRRAPMLALVGDEDEGLRALAAGFAAYMKRPLDLDSAIVTLRRVIKRGHDTGTPAAGRLLIASAELYPLISIGTAMQRQLGCEVYLGRGSKDAAEQFCAHNPGAVLIDLRLQHISTHELLKSMAQGPHQPAIILVIEEYERARASMITEAKIAGIIVKPVHLLGLADEVRKATGLAAAADAAAAASLLKSEISRIMKPELA